MGKFTRSTGFTKCLFEFLRIKKVFTMKYILIFIFVCSAAMQAQYTTGDKKLAATAFTRNFDEAAETKYLESDNPEKITAGLLSVSQSEDTAFVPFIISIPSDKFAREICFALGQLGSCQKSVEYLKKLFHRTDEDPLTKYYALTALGKTADTAFASELVTDYSNAESKNDYNGISLALYYLYSNGKITEDNVRPVLENELYFSSSRQYEAAFCLYRTGPVKSEEELISRTINKITETGSDNSVTGRSLPYLLGCLRKLEYFPDDFSLINTLRKTDDFQTLVEAVRASSYYKYKSKEELDVFLHYLDNDNENITREAASAVKNLKLNSELRDYLYLRLSERLHDNSDMEKYTKGELFLSYLEFFPEGFNDILVKAINDKISPEYIYKICAAYPGSKEVEDFLSEKYFKEELKEKVSILESLAGYYQDDDAVRPVLFNALSSAHPSLISVAAESIDSAFTEAHRDTLSGLIISQTQKHLNDPDFIESLMSLENLAGKISDSLKQQITGLLETSSQYSAVKFAAGLKGESPKRISKDIDNFDTYWDYAFKYREAEIVTEKGSFTISFLPGYAPVTVGSFCSLADKDFFNRIPFHRVVPGFVIQGGDPTGTGYGGPGYEIISEFSPLEFNKGMVGMASAGKDTEGSQWFVTTGNYPHLNGKYTIFAEVLKGMETVDHLTQDTRILRINLIR